MSWKSFKKLNRQISPEIITKENVPNGPIPSGIRLAVALRYFAGGSMLDIMISHGISRSECYLSIWLIVNAINSNPDFDMVFPRSHAAQKEIARGFQSKSECGFNNCAGCVDGILIWLEKPNSTFCEEAGVEAGKFFCGRKHKFGLNMQATCDARRRFIDVSIRNPASASDFLSFATSGLYSKLAEAGFMAPGLTLYGDNAYVNSQTMTSPFPNVGAGYKDDFNFYQSQVRIIYILYPISKQTYLTHRH
jgi:hypothetical protein